MKFDKLIQKIMNEGYDEWLAFDGNPLEDEDPECSNCGCPLVWGDDGEPEECPECHPRCSHCKEEIEEQDEEGRNSGVCHVCSMEQSSTDDEESVI